MRDKSRWKLIEAGEMEATLGVDSGWEIAENKLTKTFRFKNFDAAMDFMQAMRTPINAHDHHPEWFNVYNRLRVDLTNHEAGGVSLLDLDMAQIFDSAYEKLV